MRSLHLSLEQETSTDGMEFTGPAATVYEKVHGDYMNATADELWDKMQRRLYSEGQVQAQHSRLHTVKLGADETIEDFSQRIRDLGTGLSEAAEDAMLRQSFRESVITTLKLHFLAISAGFDEVVSRLSQMSEAAEETASRVGSKGSENTTFPLDESALPGTLSNPVGPDPRHTKDIRVLNCSRKCYKCQRCGHTRSGAMYVDEQTRSRDMATEKGGQPEQNPPTIQR
jgi:hypothetical protein